MRNTPTDLVLLQIAEGLQRLSKNPDLSKMITDTYSLMDSEIAKVDEARSIINKADQFLLDLNKEKAIYADVVSRIEEAESIEKKNSDTVKSIIQRENKIIQDSRDNDFMRQNNLNEKKRLKDLETELQNKANSLEEDKIKVDKIMDDLNKRSEALSAPIEIS